MQTSANGMAFDLGLHQKSARRLVDFPGRPPPPKLSVAEQLERQRTFLGCYFLSSLWVFIWSPHMLMLNFLGSLEGCKGLIF